MVGCSAVARRLGGRNPTDAGPVVATVAGAHGMAAVLLSAVLPPGRSGRGRTLGGAAGCGVDRRGGGHDRRPARLRPAAALAARPGLAADRRAGRCGRAGRAGGVSAALLFAALVTSAAQVHEPVAAAGEVAGAVGSTVLSVGYLPNAVGAATSWLLGPGFSIGTASASVFGVVAGPLPSVPLMAAMPVNPPAGWAPLAFVLPVLIGVRGGSLCRPAGEPADRLRAVVDRRTPQSPPASAVLGRGVRWAARRRARSIRWPCRCGLRPRQRWAGSALPRRRCGARR